MASASKQVIDAVAARLATTVLAGARVYTDRAWPVDGEQLPCWMVVPDAEGDEAIEPLTIHWPRLQMHTLPVTIFGLVKAASALDDAMDAMLVQAAGALFDTQAHATLQPLVGVQLRETARRRRMDSEGQAAIGRLFLGVEAQFKTYENAPEVLA